MSFEVGAPRFRAGARPGWANWRRVRRVAVTAASVALVPVVISYVSALTSASNSGFGIRSVEWMRDHGAAALVSKVENLYYSLNAPSKGGPALRALPSQGAAAGAAGARAALPVRLYRPPRIKPIIDPALPGEGVWHPTRANAGVNPPILVTSFRAEPAYPRLVTAVAWIDPRRASVSLYPGRIEPSVPIPRGSMDVPVRYRRKLLATFNSGFKLSDARGGFAIAGHTYAPMQPGIATLIRYTNGRLNIRAWSGGPRVGPNVVFARQNLPLIVNHGVPNPNLSDGPEWGATLGNAIRVWRSAVGVDHHGNLLYVAADNQTVGSLARALAHAGAVRAMELDINSYWVSFISYRSPNAGGPSNLISSMTRPASRYLSPDDRDFFGVYSR
jgi:hypothetical protein